MTDFGGKTSIFSHPVYLFLRKFSLQDSRGGSHIRSGNGFTDGLGSSHIILVCFHIWLYKSRALV
ncbi:hypothetical protein ELT49_25935 [Escherichia coli]|nr:hypothetical protein ELT49_25935 [Escherichia coli]